MFSADISQVQFWEDSRDQRNTHGDNLDYLFPKFSHPSPWLHRSAAGKASMMEDFVLIAEFSEQEGPRPVIVIPKDGGGDFDQNEFSVKILAVDHQSSIVEGSNMTEDAQVVMSDTEKNAHAFIHHIVLNDIQARGYVRPFCISYVTADSQKIMKCYETISTQMKKVARVMKYGNRLVFMRDLEKYLEDLDYTKAHLLISQRSQTSSTTNDNEVLIALNTIRQSMEEVKDIVAKLSNMLNDSELEEKFQALERQLRPNRKESLASSQDTNSLKDFPVPTRESEAETSGSYTDRLTPEFSLFGKSKDLKPKILDVSTLKGKRRFDRSLRGLHELCSWGAREGLKKLRSIREYLSKDYAGIYMDELDERVSIPDSSLLSFGYDTIGANFLTCYSSRDVLFCKKKGCMSHPFHYPASLGSVDSFKSLPSSYHSILDDDTLYSARSSMMDASSQLSAFERQASITDSFDARDSLDDQEDWMFHQDGESEAGQEYSTSVIHSSFMDTIKYEDSTNNITGHIDTTGLSNDSDYDIIDKDKDLTCSAPGCGCNHLSEGNVKHEKVTQHSNHNKQSVHNTAELKDAYYLAERSADENRHKHKGHSELSETDNQATNLSSTLVSNTLEGIYINGTRDLGKDDDTDKINSDRLQDDIDTGIMNMSTTTLCDKEGSAVIMKESSNCDKDVTSVETETNSKTGDKSAITSNLKENPSGLSLNNRNKTSQKEDSDFDELREDVTFDLNQSDDIDEHFGNSSSYKKTGAMETGGLFVETGSLFSDTDSLESHTNKLSLEREKLTREIENTLDIGCHSSSYSRRKEKLFLPFSNRQEADNTCVQCLQKVLYDYNNLQHVIYSLMSGRPVVIVGTRRTELQIRELMYALTIFAPIAPSHNVSSMLCQIKQLKVSDIHKTLLRGVIRSENRSIEKIIAASVRRYITLIDVEKMVLHCQPYQGMLLNFVSAIYTKKRTFKSDRALYNYVQMCLMEISTRAFTFYHCITESDADTDFCGICVPRKAAMLELSSDKYLNKNGLLNSDSRIIKHLAELVKKQQIEEEFKCKYLTDSPVYPFRISYLPLHTYRL